MIWGILIALIVVLFVFLYKKSDKILDWFAKKFHKETRIREKAAQDEFTVEIITPNGDLYEKGVKKSDEEGNDKNRSDK